MLYGMDPKLYTDLQTIITNHVSCKMVMIASTLVIHKYASVFLSLQWDVSLGCACCCSRCNVHLQQVTLLI